MARRVELLAGLLAGWIGPATVTYAVVGPTVRYQRGGGEVVETSLLSAGIGPVQAMFLVAIFLLFIGVAAGAIAHAQERRLPGLTLLRGSAILVILLTWAGLANIGLLLLPGALLALVSAVAAAVVRRDQSPGRQRADMEGRRG